MTKSISPPSPIRIKCIDLSIQTERPIRGMGKYTLEEGIIQREIFSLLIPIKLLRPKPSFRHFAPVAITIFSDSI